MDEFAAAQTEFAAAQAELSAGQKHTDERLSALIDMVERDISERRNGNAQS